MKAIKLSKLALSLLCGSVILFTSCGKSEIENIPGSDKEQQEPEKKKPEGSQEPEKKKPEGSQEPEKKKPEGNQEPEKKKPEGNQEPEKKKPMMLNRVSLKLKSMETVNVTIENGEAPYDINVVDKEVAQTKLLEDKKSFAVTGLKEGKTEIIVTDKNKSEARVTVVVDNGKPKLQPLRLSKSKVELTMGSAKAKESLNVQSGKFPYHASNYDTEIVQVSIWDSSITLTAVKQGTTTVTINDSEGRTGKITVVVK